MCRSHQKAVAEVVRLQFRAKKSVSREAARQLSQPELSCLAARFQVSQREIELSRRCVCQAGIELSGRFAAFETASVRELQVLRDRVSVEY